METKYVFRSKSGHGLSLWYLAPRWGKDSSESIPKCVLGRQAKHYAARIYGVVKTQSQKVNYD
jgi:hypothetical protein